MLNSRWRWKWKTHCNTLSNSPLYQYNGFEIMDTLEMLILKRQYLTRELWKEIITINSANVVWILHAHCNKETHVFRSSEAQLIYLALNISGLSPLEPCGKVTDDVLLNSSRYKCPRFIPIWFTSQTDACSKPITRQRKRYKLPLPEGAWG